MLSCTGAQSFDERSRVIFPRIIGRINMGDVERSGPARLVIVSSVIQAQCCIPSATFAYLPAVSFSPSGLVEVGPMPKRKSPIYGRMCSRTSALEAGRRERNFWMRRQRAKNRRQNAHTSTETKIRELIGRKSPQKRPIWRLIGNVRFAETGWWRPKGPNCQPPTQSLEPVSGTGVRNGNFRCRDGSAKSAVCAS